MWNIAVLLGLPILSSADFCSQTQGVMNRFC